MTKLTIQPRAKLAGPVPVSELAFRNRATRTLHAQGLKLSIRRGGYLIRDREGKTVATLADLPALIKKLNLIRPGERVAR